MLGEERSSPWTEQEAGGVALRGEVPVPQVAAADRELHLVELEGFRMRPVWKAGLRCLRQTSPGLPASSISSLPLPKSKDTETVTIHKNSQSAGIFRPSLIPQNPLISLL